MSQSAPNKIDVNYIAQLARLELDPAAIPALQKDMENIVAYINELSELDVSNVEPTAHAVSKSNVWREDVSRAGQTQAEMLANAPAIVDGDLVKVPQVLPGEGMN